MEKCDVMADTIMGKTADLTGVVQKVTNVTRRVSHKQLFLK